MQKPSLSRNATLSVIQTLISGGILFFLYRYLLIVIGPEQLGIWSTVLATASASKISELGFTASAVKFTARYLARGEDGKACDVIMTTFFTIGSVLTVALAILYPVIVWALPKFIPFHYMQQALQLLPYAFLSIWISSIAGVFLSGLEGCQRIDMRAWISTGTSILFLCIAWFLLPQYGLIGLAWAQVTQSIAMLVGSILLLRSILPKLFYSKFWCPKIFSEMFRYGVNFQITSISMLMMEPVTKALITKFGGLGSVAYYEMSSRMILQLRSILISANRVLVPRIAELHETKPENINGIYLETYQIILFLSLPLYSTIAVSAPFVSWLWIGHFEPYFVVFTIITAFGYFINTLAGPAYFVNLGTGTLRWNTISHVVISALNGILGYVLGPVYGSYGVVFGFAISLATGSFLIIFGYHRIQKIELHSLFPIESKKLIFSCSVGILLLACLYVVFSPVSTFAKSCILLIVHLLVIMPLILSHNKLRTFLDIRKSKLTT